MFNSDILKFAEGKLSRESTAQNLITVFYDPDI